MGIESALMQTPVGILEIKATETHINSILFIDKNISSLTAGIIHSNQKISSPVLNACITQFQQYFEGKRFEFDVPIMQEGSDFQQKVWAGLLGVPYGKTISYLELSKRVSNTKAIRAVGTTNGKNNLSIVVPCHRVIGSDGSLTGYSGGLWRKQWLLNHENKFANGVQTLF